MEQPWKRVRCPFPDCEKIIRAMNEYCWEHKEWIFVSRPPHLPQDFKEVRSCILCNKQFKITSSQSKYCPECRAFHCPVCGDQFIQSPSDKTITCPNCRGETRKAPVLTCQYCNQLFKQRSGRFTKYCGKKCRYAATRKKIGSPNHRTWEYKHWRRQVLKRDLYTCQHCGATQFLQPHHIKPMSEYPSLAYAVSNGITLCSNCHTITHDGKPTNRNGTDRLECAICGNPITGTGKSPHCRSCAMRLSPKVKAAQAKRKRNSNGQFMPEPA